MLKKHTFKNGLRLLMIPQPQSLAATVCVIVKAGSEYESKSGNGISHFLEHMVFKGTERRPNPGDISREMESMGAEYNAFTGKELTMYYAKSEKANFSKIWDLVSDMYLNPVLAEAEIEKEKGVIIEEINLYEDTPARKVHDIFASLIYGDQPAGWDISGTKENVRSFTRKDISGYRSKHYVPANTIVVAAGAFSADKFKKEVELTLGKLPAGKRSKKSKTTQGQSRPRLKVEFKDSKQSHLVLGFPACDIFDKRKHALRLLAEILGGGMSSRLFVRVREQMGAAYYVRADEDLSTDHGHFAVSAGVEVGKAEVVLTEILKELGRLKKELVPEKELKKAKSHLLGGLILGLETSDDLASFYGGQEVMTGKPISPSEIRRIINGVSAEQVRSVAREFLRGDKLNLAVIGPYRNPEKFRKIMKLPG